MANDLTTAQPKSMQPLPQWLRSSVQAMSPDYPPKIPADRSLTTIQRGEVQSLIADCDRSMEGATSREIGTIVMRLLADYPADGADPSIAKARAANWTDALEGMPAWALEAARLKWVRREVQANTDYAPKPGQFREIALGCMAPVFERKSLLNHLLIAEPLEASDLDDEKRERLAAMLDDVAKGLKANSDPRFPGKEPEPFIPPEEREERALKHAMAVAKDFRAAPPALSESTLRKLETEGHIDIRSAA